MECRRGSEGHDGSNSSGGSGEAGGTGDVADGNTRDGGAADGGLDSEEGAGVTGLDLSKSGGSNGSGSLGLLVFHLGGNSLLVSRGDGVASSLENPIGGVSPGDRTANRTRRPSSNAARCAGGNIGVLSSDSEALAGSIELSSGSEVSNSGSSGGRVDVTGIGGSAVSIRSGTLDSSAVPEGSAVLEARGELDLSGIGEGCGGDGALDHGDGELSGGHDGGNSDGRGGDSGGSGTGGEAVNIGGNSGGGKEGESERLHLEFI